MSPFISQAESRHHPAVRSPFPSHVLVLLFEEVQPHADHQQAQDEDCQDAEHDDKAQPAALNNWPVQLKARIEAPEPAEGSILLAEMAVMRHLADSCFCLQLRQRSAGLASSASRIAPVHVPIPLGAEHQDEPLEVLNHHVGYLQPADRGQSSRGRRCVISAAPSQVAMYAVLRQQQAAKQSRPLTA